LAGGQAAGGRGVLNGQLLPAGLGGNWPLRPPAAGGGWGEIQIAACFLLQERRGILNRLFPSLGLLQTTNLAQGAL